MKRACRAGQIAVPLGIKKGSGSRKIPPINMETTTDSIAQKITDSLLSSRGFIKKPGSETNFFQEYQTEFSNEEGCSTVVILNNGGYTVEHRLFGNSLKYAPNPALITPTGRMTTERADEIRLIADMLKSQVKMIHNVSILADQAKIRQQQDEESANKLLWNA